MLEHDCTPKHLHKVLMKKSRFASKTVRESMTTAPEVIKGTNYNPDGVKAEYKVTSNKARIEQAHKNLLENEHKVRDRIFNEEDINDQTIVDGEILAVKLQQQGHFDDAINVLESISKKLTAAGQTVQAASIWNKLTPEGALVYAKRVVDRANKNTPKGTIAEKLNKKAKEIIEAVGKPDDLDLENAVDKAQKEVQRRRKQNELKLKLKTVDEGKVNRKALEVKKRLAEKELKAEQNRIRPDGEKIKQLKLKIKSHDERIKKLLAKALAEDPTVPKEKKAKVASNLTEDQQTVETFAKERLRAKGHIRNLLEPKTGIRSEKVPYKFTATERDLVGQLDAEKNSPARKLAKRVEGHIDTKAPKDLTPEQEMVNTLFKVAKETLPEKTKLAPKDPLDAIVKAVKNKAEYAEIYQKAKDIVSKKFENNPQAQAALKAYTEKHFERPYSEAQLKKTVEQHIKSQEVDIKALVKQHYFKVNETLESLEKTLVSKAGFSDEEAKLFAGHIQKELGAKVNQAKQSQLKALLKEAPPFVRRPLAARINELANLGALNEQTYRQAVAKKLGLASLDAEVAKKIYSAASELQNTVGKRDREVKGALLKKLIADQVPVSGLQKTAAAHTIAMLLNTTTATRNIVGNGLFAAVEHGTTAGAAIIDRGVSAITRKRTVVFPKAKISGSGFFRGAKEGFQEAMLGIDTQGTQFDLPKGQTFKHPVLNTLEKGLNIALRAPDKAFYSMTYRESVLNQLEAAGKNAKITPEILARAQYEALYKTFQDESTAAKIFTKLKEALNDPFNKGVPFGLGDVIDKFPKTPGNLLARTFDYSPVGFVKAIYEPLKPLMAKVPLIEKLSGNGKFDQRQFSQSMARAIIGSGGVMGTAYTLGKLGLATGAPPSDPDIKRAQKAKGIRPYSFNVDGQLRFAMSGMNVASGANKPQIGDRWVTYDWAQPFAGNIAAGVNLSQMGKNSDPQQVQTALSAVLKATAEGADTLTNQGVMQGFQRIAGARDEHGNHSWSAGFVDSIASLPSSFVPTAVKQINNLTDNTARETYDPDKFNQTFNEVKAKVPGLSQTLPARINTYGQPDEKYQDGSNNAFNVFLNPAFVSKLKSDPTGDEVVRLYEDAGETQQAPQTAPKKITITRHGQHEKIQLTPQQLTEYQTYIGQGSKKILDSVVQMPAYQRLSDEGKASLMASLITDVNTAAKISIFHHHPTARPTYVTMGLLRNSRGLVMAGIRKHFASEYRSEIKKRRAPSY